MVLAFILFVNLIAVCADAISDSGINRKANVTWFEFHFFKWLRFYLPQLVVAFLLHYAGLYKFSTYYILGGIIYICAGWIIWKVFYGSSILGASNVEDY